MINSPPEDDLAEPVISIGVLALKVGLSVSAVRKYENEGLLIAHRSESGHRLFSYEDITRVQHIHHLIQDLGYNTECIRRMLALIPCWDLLPCDGECIRNCPAYVDETRPCWMVRGTGCVSKGNECRQCEVYRYGSLCTLDVKRLVHEQRDRDDQSNGALTLLLDRRRRSRKGD